MIGALGALLERYWTLLERHCSGTGTLLERTGGSITRALLGQYWSAGSVTRALPELYWSFAGALLEHYRSVTGALLLQRYWSVT